MCLRDKILGNGQSVNKITTIFCLILLYVALIIIVLDKMSFFVEFNRIYDRLGITIKERGESFYQPLMPGVVEDLKSKGIHLIIHT